jgi:hypothetical protein
MKVYGGTMRMRSVEVEYWAGEYAYQNLRVIDLSENRSRGHKLRTGLTQHLRRVFGNVILRWQAERDRYILVDGKQEDMRAVKRSNQRVQGT